jgi:hypothetical protein
MENRRKLIGGGYGWIRICRSCGDYNYANPAKTNTQPCRMCGYFTTSGKGIWQWVISTIMDVYRGKWYNPFSWLKWERCMLTPPKLEKP